MVIITKIKSFLDKKNEGIIKTEFIKTNNNEND